jgi:peroxiredoxin
MLYETAELGPFVNTRAPDFALLDHKRQLYMLDDLMGESGVILGFIGDIWQPASVRRILWLQRHVNKFAVMGTPIALLVRDYPHTLNGFHSSSPLPVPFPLLADSDGQVHRTYTMDRNPGMLLIDRRHVLRKKWLMPNDRVWPRMQELVQAIQVVQA